MNYALSDDGVRSWCVDPMSSSQNRDGDRKKAKIAEADYLKSFADADDRYAKMLSTLLAQAKGPNKPGS